jgi:hypothetical protein
MTVLPAAILPIVALQPRSTWTDMCLYAFFFYLKVHLFLTTNHRQA